MKLRIIGIMLMMFPFVGYAQGNVSDSLIKELHSCDKKIFVAIKNNEQLFGQLGEIKVRADIAYPKVPDRFLVGKNYLFFSRPLVGELEIVGYDDESVDFSAGWRMYNWGFLVKGNADEVLLKVARLVLGNVPASEASAVLWTKRRNVSLSGDDWHAFDIRQVDNKNYALRGFSIESADEKFPNVTSVGCFLFDEISDNLLLIRPDVE